MATCPQCHRSSRQHFRLMTCDVLMYQPTEGGRPRAYARLECCCGWRVFGYVDNGYLTPGPVDEDPAGKLDG